MTETTNPKQKRRWWSVFALSAAAFVDGSEDYSLSILWPRMFPGLGMRVAQLGSLISISQIIRTISLPFWGYAADKFSRKAILVGVTGFWGLLTMLVAFVHNFNQLLAVRVISSLGLCALWPTAFSLLSDLFPSKERGKAAGVMTAVSFSGTIAAYGILPYLAGTSPEGWRLGFIVMGIASAATGIFMLVLNDPPRGSTEPEISAVAGEASQKFAFKISDLPKLARVRSWWVLIVQNSVDAVALSVLYMWAFTWLDEIGLGENGFMVIALLSLANIAGHALFGWLGDVLDARYPRRGRVAMAFTGLAVSVPALAGFISLGNQGMGYLMLFGVLVGLGLASVDTGARWPITQGVLLPETRATGRAVMDMAIGAVGAAAMAISTLLVDRYGVTTMMLLLIPIPKLIGALTWLPVFWTYPQDRANLHRTLEERRAALDAVPVK